MGVVTIVDYKNVNLEIVKNYMLQIAVYQIVASSFYNSVFWLFLDYGQISPSTHSIVDSKKHSCVVKMQTFSFRVSSELDGPS